MKNKNSRIVTRQNGSTTSTYTARRDAGSLNADVTSTRNGHKTSFFVDKGNGVYVEFSGREARTLLTLLERHFYGV